MSNPFQRPRLAPLPAQPTDHAYCLDHAHPGGRCAAPRPLPKPSHWPTAASNRVRFHLQLPTPHVHRGALPHRSLAARAAGSHLGLLAQLPSSQSKRRIPALTGDGTPASGSARLFPDPLGCFRIGSAGAAGVGGVVWSRDAECIRVDARLGSRLSCGRVGPPPRSFFPWKLRGLRVCGGLLCLRVF